MSDDEDRPCKYGTALPELPADVIPTKKPITVADQIAVDANGKRRFHGAFTGGFSAGFWNTVGSLEGWKPQAFKSSRSEKAQRLLQAPSDFMDDEDVGEFGIAPQRIQTTEDFTAKAPDKDSRKRPALREDEPVLGTPVLQLFLKPAKDKASVSLLKKMGWREHQGIGSRQTKREKKNAAERFLKERGDARTYKCDMGPFEKSIEETDDEEQNEDSPSDDSDEEITFAPDDYEPFLHAFKTNRFGLGYVGLNKSSSTTQSQHVNLFAPFEVLDRKNKKLSITGQAFGVGAFEEDDDDIYAKDDMTTYDFSLGEKAKAAVKKQAYVQSSNIIGGFAVSKSHQKRMNKKMFTVDIPSSFTPRNWALRKTRFGPAINPPNVLNSTLNEGRHVLTAEERGKLLNEKSVPQKQPDVKELRSEMQSTALLQDTAVKTEPQLISKKQSEPKALNFIKLPESLNFDRFVSEKDLVVVKDDPVVVKETKVESNKIEVKRIKSPWQPCSLLYEKMNIAEPSGGSKRKSSKGGSSFSLFQCLSETTKNRKKTYRERPDFTDVFTKAEKADDDILTTNANIVTTSSISIQPTSTSPPELHAPVIPSLPIAPSTSTTSLTASISRPLPVQQPTIKPKTDLEIKSLAMGTKHPAEKKDLFKAIFDSDDDDDDVDETNPSDKSLQPPAQNQSDYLPKSSAILNVLRNTSPPRGIFSNLFTPKVTIVKPPEIDLSTKLAMEEETNYDAKTDLLYGPTLPTKLVSATATSPIPNPTSFKEKFKSRADEWVEKIEDTHKKKDKKKHKKAKKHKRDKAKKKKTKNKE